MTGLMIAGILLAIGLLVWGGVAIRSYLLRVYRYDIFSGLNLMFGILSFLAVLIGAGLTFEDGFHLDMNALVLFIFAAIVYVGMYIVNAKKSNWWLALIAVMYQMLCSVLMFFVVLFFLFSKRVFWFSKQNTVIINN